ncbi:MAG: ribose 5-phosphate isomerase B [Candidatus Omnitrophica bacterium]|nr:ribose 5-phosphate isomerase B [Candidatus Omnitrophota bacterium]
MTIFIGADHRGFELKAKIVSFLRAQGHEAVDVGTYAPEPPCDYPKLSLEVAVNVVKHKNSRGILLCLTGIGHSIAANKVPGAYAALCHSKEVAILSRQHNNANVLVLGANFMTEKEMLGIIKVWLSTEFEGGRHLRRVNQVKAIEKKFMK